MAYKDREKMTEILNFAKKWDDYWKYNRDQYHLYMSFVMGSQWQDNEARLFENYKKIPLQVNKLAPLAAHIVGEFCQNTPAFAVEPMSNIEPKLVEIRKALVDSISINSHAKEIYQNCFFQTVVGGYSASCWQTVYNNKENFDQDLKVFGFNDPTYCYWDISAVTPAKTDGMGCGYRTRLSRERFKSLYGSKLERMIPPDTGDDSRLMFTDEAGITMLHHYQRTFKIETLYQLSNDKVINKDVRKDLDKRIIGDKEFLIFEGEPVLIVNKRDEPNYKIKFYKGAGDYIMEDTDFVSEQLPLVFWDQKSFYDKKGKQVTRPMLKDARDSQRFLNYLATQIAYILKVSRWDQFMASKQNVKSPDTQNIWRNPQTIQGALIYDESPNGNKPEQLRPPEISQSLEAQYIRTLNDIQSSTGIYNAQVGDQGNETSGKHFDGRVKRGNYTTNAPFQAAFNAITVMAEIGNEMIPAIYDTERTLMLDMPDRGIRPVSINKPMDEYGLQYQNDMRVGKYKIRLKAGSSIEGQREENLESMNAVLAHDPEAFRLIADLYVESLPMNQNIEMRNRLRTLVPPEIIEAGKTGEPLPPKPQGPPPELMIKMQELQLKEKELMIKQQDLERKSQQAAVESQQEMQLEWQKLETERLEAAASLQEMQLRYQAEVHKTSADLNIAHANNMVKLLTHHPKEPKNGITKR